MNKTVSIIIFIATLFLLGGGLFLATRKPPQTVSVEKLDQLAKCLTDKGMVMYGAYWCPHCQAVKKSFGSSFQHVKYVECTVETKNCSDHNVTGYPTFIFADGSRLEGEQSLANLAQKASCEYPQ